MNLGIIGSDSFSDYHLLKSAIERHFTQLDALILCGSTRTDQLASRYAREKDVQTIIIEPLPGPEAKEILSQRAENIARFADTIIAFWNGDCRIIRYTLHQAALKGVGVIWVDV